jgi:CrcB protein
VSAKTWLWFVLAAAAGGLARWLIDGSFERRGGNGLPWGTWLVNRTGSFTLGVLTGLALYHGMGRVPQTVLGTGFCGAYTTFSTFSFETVRMAEEGQLLDAGRYIVLSVVVGGLAAGAGLAVTLA